MCFITFWYICVKLDRYIYDDGKKSPSFIYDQYFWLILLLDKQLCLKATGGPLLSCPVLSCPVLSSPLLSSPLLIVFTFIMIYYNFQSLFSFVKSSHVTYVNPGTVLT